MEFGVPTSDLRTVLENVGPFPPGAAAVRNWLIRAVTSAERASLLGEMAVDDDRPLDIPVLIPPRAVTDRASLAKLKSLHPDELMSDIGSEPDAIAVQAGLLLLHDDLDSSHALSQSIEGEGRHQNGDYWHGIMHRREPDYSNAKYWFRRVGRHPIFDELAEQAQAVLKGTQAPETSIWVERLKADSGWEPFAFIDLCAECEGQDHSPLTEATRSIQFVEMLLLLKQSVDDARSE